MRGHKIVNRLREGPGANTHVIRLHAVALADLVEAFGERAIRGTEGQEANLRAGIPDHDRSGNQLTRLFKLQRQPIHHRLILAGILGVASRVVVSRAAGEVSRLGVARSGQRAPADGVAVHVAIAGKAAQPLQILGSQHLAAIQRLDGIIEGLATSSCSCPDPNPRAQRPVSASARPGRRPPCSARSTPSSNPAAE